MKMINMSGRIRRVDLHPPKDDELMTHGKAKKSHSSTKGRHGVKGRKAKPRSTTGHKMKFNKKSDLA